MTSGSASIVRKPSWLQEVEVEVVTSTEGSTLTEKCAQHDAQAHTTSNIMGVSVDTLVREP